MVQTNKHKIVNDPVYGFINIDYGILFKIVEHPCFQRLSRIKQLGLTGFVYPGANHTRFQHALGATHLMSEAIKVIKSKGHEITKTEAKAALIAILLHDIGHGPFSHALEYSFIEGITHEDISLILMEKLNKEMNGKLSLGMEIFKNQHEKTFLHQLVSSQLDVDRLDYLRRDSFFTGVSEGVIGSDRIIKMLDVVDKNLVVEAKGIYSIEKFLIARRLMYWQVYLHKTVLVAETLMIKILQRAKQLAVDGHELFGTPALNYFLYNKIDKPFFENDPQAIENFISLDDHDIMSSIKVWTSHPDFALSYMCKSLVNRHLYRIEISTKPFSERKKSDIKSVVLERLNAQESDLPYLVWDDSISNNAYSAADDRINIKFKNGKLIDIAEASDMLNISVLSKNVKKYYLCYPKVL